MKSNMAFFLLPAAAMLLSACGASCPPERISYAGDSSDFPPAGDLVEFQPSKLELKGRQVEVDRVITGPVCNEHWSGTIYVTCDIQIPAWERDPFFFQDCDLEVAEGSLVYVEAHNDRVYDEGCSCHE